MIKLKQMPIFWLILYPKYKKAAPKNRFLSYLEFACKMESDFREIALRHLQHIV